MAKPHLRKPKQRRAWQRLAVLALAVAVPLAFVPWSSFAGSDGDGAAHARAIASELPEENFPGSAFYFLEDAPALQDEPELAVEDMEASIPASSISGAKPLVATGSDRDHARAQRCLTMALHYEASGESVSGKRAVAQVILNRVAHPAFPATVCGVVFEGAHRQTGCQFSFACDGAMLRRAEASFGGMAARVAREALAGGVYAPVGYATHFHTLDIHPYWAPSLTNVATVGSHTFYRWPGAQGEAAAFTTRYAGGEPYPDAKAQRPGSTAARPSLAQTQGPEVLAVPGTPVAQEAPAEAPAPAPALPTSGQVREEYAQSGQWLDQP